MDEGTENDASDRVERLDRVVRYARQLHLAGLGNEVVEDLVVAKIEEGEANDDPTGFEAAFDFGHEVLRPR